MNGYVPLSPSKHLCGVHLRIHLALNPLSTHYLDHIFSRQSAPIMSQVMGLLASRLAPSYTSTSPYQISSHKSRFSCGSMGIIIQCCSDDHPILAMSEQGQGLIPSDDAAFCALQAKWIKVIPDKFNPSHRSLGPNTGYV
jgi:hypothetical protein